MAARFFKVRTPQRDPIAIRGKLIVAPTLAHGCLITELSTSEAEVKLDHDQELPHRVMLFEVQQRRIWECVVASKLDRRVSLSFVDICNHATRRELMEAPELGLLAETDTPPTSPELQPAAKV
jgi:hypothetical protein